MKNNLLFGISFFLKGLRLVFTRPFRRYIFLPIGFNLLLTIASVFLINNVLDYLSSLLNFDTHWPQWIENTVQFVVTAVSYIILFVAGILSFIVFGNIAGSPFYSTLSNKIIDTSLHASMPLSFASLWQTLLRTVPRELYKLLYALGGFLVCTVLSFFPLTTVISPLLWGLTLAWICAMQYTDYAADNQNIPLKQFIHSLNKVPFTLLGFGGAVTLLMGIPGANLIVPPAAVAGGTLLWKQLTQSDAFISLPNKNYR